MPSAWSPLTLSAATEHCTGQLLQSTAGANIIFINIDWKRDRHANPKTTKRNLTVLAETTSGIVTKMKPAVICCCEVGTAASPMTSEQVSDMVDAMRKAWEEAATKHPAISFLFEDDAPYLTIWDDNRCKCTHGRILRNVYDVQMHARRNRAAPAAPHLRFHDPPLTLHNLHATYMRPACTVAMASACTVAMAR